MTLRPRRGGRAAAAWAVALLLVLVAAHTLLWEWAEQRLRGGFDAWVAGRRAAGWTVQAGEPVGAGWPLAAELVVTPIGIEGGRSDIPQGFAWSADRVTLSVGLFQPRLLTISPEGAQHLRVGGLPEIPYTAERLRIDVPLAPGLAGPVADLDARSLRAGMPRGHDGSWLTAGLLRAHFESRPAAARGEPGVAVQSSAEAIALPAGLPWALGGRISSVSLDGALTGPLPGMPGVSRRAAAWRDAGGTVEVQRLALGWGPLGLTGRATLALDANLQPTGTGTARIVGYAETLDALAKGGALNAGAALAAKAFAGLIAATPAGGGPPEVEVPLALHDRIISIRQIPLARIPPLQWPSE